MRWSPIAFLIVVGCTHHDNANDELSADELAKLSTMTMTSAIPPSPTNAVADRDDAAALGRRLFFDKRMSADGKVSCASCHDPEKGFSDPRPVSLGVAERPGGRHSMPITNVAFQRALFWDGRADTLWSQPLQAIESEREMDFSRAEVAHFVAASYAADYEAVFGPLPELAGVPARSRPGISSWVLLTAQQQDDVQRVFANVGKLLEAYQRRIVCADTRFDRWVRGELELTEDERAGAARFVREGCVRCHDGPSFSDGEFHNIGIGSSTSTPDRGAADSAARLAADIMNGAGVYSDDRAAGAARLVELGRIARPLGSFRTPSLRGVTQRQSFGHRGHRLALDDFINDVYDEPHLQRTAVGELDEEVRDVELRAGAVLAFLRTLECPPLPAWGPPP